MSSSGLSRGSIARHTQIIEGKIFFDAGPKGASMAINPRSAKRSSRRGLITRFPRLHLIPRVVGEPNVLEPFYMPSHVLRYVKRMRDHPTRAERQFRVILNSLNGGTLKGRFNTQHVVTGRWIVDFFFPEVRLAVEIDGGVHQSPEQKARDQEKEKDCARFDITLIRVTNGEVFGDRTRLVEKLRRGWRAALEREYTIVGKEYPPSKPA
jgi:very-short-patch-repair endonuclease